MGGLSREPVLRGNSMTAKITYLQGQVRMQGAMMQASLLGAPRGSQSVQSKIERSESNAVEVSSNTAYRSESGVPPSGVPPKEHDDMPSTSGGVAERQSLDGRPLGRSMTQAASSRRSTRTGKPELVAEELVVAEWRVHLYTARRRAILLVRAAVRWQRAVKHSRRKRPKPVPQRLASFSWYVASSLGTMEGRFVEELQTYKTTSGKLDKIKNQLDVLAAREPALTQIMQRCSQAVEDVLQGRSAYLFTLDVPTVKPPHNHNPALLPPPVPDLPESIFKAPASPQRVAVNIPAKFEQTLKAQAPGQVDRLSLDTPPLGAQKSFRMDPIVIKSYMSSPTVQARMALVGGSTDASGPVVEQPVLGRKLPPINSGSGESRYHKPWQPRKSNIKGKAASRRTTAAGVGEVPSWSADAGAQAIQDEDHGGDDGDLDTPRKSASKLRPWEEKAAQLIAINFLTVDERLRRLAERMTPHGLTSNEDLSSPTAIPRSTWPMRNANSTSQLSPTPSLPNILQESMRSGTTDGNANNARKGAVVVRRSSDSAVPSMQSKKKDGKESKDGKDKDAAPEEDKPRSLAGGGALSPLMPQSTRLYRGNSIYAKLLGRAVTSSYPPPLPMVVPSLPDFQKLMPIRTMVRRDVPQQPPGEAGGAVEGGEREEVEEAPEEEVQINGGGTAKRLNLPDTDGEGTDERVTTMVDQIETEALSLQHARNLLTMYIQRANGSWSESYEWSLPRVLRIQDMEGWQGVAGAQTLWWYR